MHRESFPILKKNIIYFDNGATSLKPFEVVEAMEDYYYNYGANIHRGDYDISLKASNSLSFLLFFLESNSGISPIIFSPKSCINNILITLFISIFSILFCSVILFNNSRVFKPIFNQILNRYTSGN